MCLEEIYNHPLKILSNTNFSSSNNNKCLNTRKDKVVKINNSNNNLQITLSSMHYLQNILCLMLNTNKNLEEPQPKKMM